VEPTVRLPDNSVSVRIHGEVGDATPRATAPNYNRLYPTPPAGTLPADYQAAHLWGPGFGNEQAAGIMLAPSEVNLRFQNAGVETTIRDMRSLASRQGGHVELDAVAQSYPRTGGYEVLREAQYRARLIGRDGTVQQTFTATISVGPPSTGGVPVVVSVSR
jgi:hypothetical protein